MQYDIAKSLLQSSKFQVFARIPLQSRLCRDSFPPGEAMALSTIHNTSINRNLPLQLEGLSFKIHAITNPQCPPIPELDRFLVLLDEEIRLATQ